MLNHAKDTWIEQGTIGVANYKTRTTDWNHQCNHIGVMKRVETSHDSGQKSQVEMERVKKICQ